MSNGIERLMQELKIHCQNLDDFNKEIVNNIDITNKAVLEFVLNFITQNTNTQKVSSAANHKSTKPRNGVYNPYND